MTDTKTPDRPLVAGGVPRTIPGPAPRRLAGPAAEPGLDETLQMSDEDWLEHALGDLHSSAWTTPTVEL